MKLSFEQIKSILPQRYPMLMIDSVSDYVEGEYLIATKAVSGSDPVFQGHYPDFAIFPGVYLVETMAQAASLLATCSKMHKDITDQKLGVPLLASVDSTRFRAPVVPGMLLTIEARVKVQKLQRVFFETAIRCGDKRVCDGVLSCSLVSLDSINGK